MNERWRVNVFIHVGNRGNSEQYPTVIYILICSRITNNVFISSINFKLPLSTRCLSINFKLPKQTFINQLPTKNVHVSITKLIHREVCNC